MQGAQRLRNRFSFLELREPEETLQATSLQKVSSHASAENRGANVGHARLFGRRNKSRAGA